MADLLVRTRWYIVLQLAISGLLDGSAELGTSAERARPTSEWRADRPNANYLALFRLTARTAKSKRCVTSPVSVNAC